MQNNEKEIPSKYFIDINIINETNFKIDYLEMHAALNEVKDNQPVKAYENEEGYVHFAIGYHKDCNCYITGSVDNKEIKKFEFNLDEFYQEYTPQSLDIHLTKDENGDFVLKR